MPCTPEYDDSYLACSETHSTLRIYHEDRSPSEVTSRLKIEPSDQMMKSRKRSEKSKQLTFNGWFLESRNVVDSLDSRRHIDWILDQLSGRRNQIRTMLQEGFKIDILSFWVSKSGNGGPTLSPFQMERLADLQIEIWWDVYFSGDDNA